MARVTVKELQERVAQLERIIEQQRKREQSLVSANMELNQRFKDSEAGKQMGEAKYWKSKYEEERRISSNLERLVERERASFSETRRQVALQKRQKSDERRVYQAVQTLMRELAKVQA